MCVHSQLCVTLCDPWMVALQAPLSMGFSRHEHWSGLPFPSPGVLPDPGIKPRSSALQADSLLCKPPRDPLDHQGSPHLTTLSVPFSGIRCIQLVVLPSCYAFQNFFIFPN